MKLCFFAFWPGVILACLIGPASQIVVAADLKTAIVEKGVQYVQSDSGQPVPDSNNGVIFEADVKATATNLISSASLRLPNGLTSDVPIDSSDELKLKKKFNKQTGVDGSFPNGSYTLTINALHDGSKVFTLPLSGDLYPNTPHCTTFATAQALDSGTYFLFSWDPMTGGGPDDFIQLHIEDTQGNKVYETPDLSELNALDGRAVSALVPPGSLPPAEGLIAYIYFKRAVSRDLTTDPGAWGYSDYYKRTKFNIQTSSTATSSDVKMISILKTRRYEQTEGGVPAPASLKTYTIDVSAETKSGAISSSSVTLPRGIPEAMSLQSDKKTFDYSDYNVNQATFDSIYPSGSFVFKINAASGAVRGLTLTLPDNAYPDAPHVTSAMSGVNPAKDFTVTWDPFAQGTSLDFTQLHIDDDQGNKVFETPDYGKSGALLGTAISAVVPANTLAPGQTYSARVVFQKNAVLDTTSYPGALGVASFASRTTFNLLADSGSGAPHVSVRSSNGSLLLTVQASAGASIRLDQSSDLRSWLPVSTNTVPTGGSVEITRSLLPGSGSSFYRATLLP